MPRGKNVLLDELYNLRDTLRSSLDQKNICTDDALLQMSKLKPSRLSDFLAIAGLDHDFLNLYAHHFLSIIQTHIKKEVKEVKVSKKSSIVLDHYKDRLTDLSKTNPNLYQGRIEKIHSFDLYDEQKSLQLLEFLSLKKKTYTLDNLSDSSYESLTTLYRSLNKEFKDSGIYSFYLAYPYVEGIFKKEQFPIKAPLAYMPVKFERNQKTYSLSYDTDKDIVLNRDLILTLTKQEKSDLPSSIALDDLSSNTIKQIIIPYYQSLGLQISLNGSSFIPFKNELKDDFIKKNPSHFIYKPYITMGSYHIYSSMIQKDMADIIETKSYNELLEGLIDESNLYDDEKSLELTSPNGDVNESNLIYINDVNFAQEKVIEMIDQEKKMVIWGPPGTGKSQTITSLIANQIMRSENVLVVSEKKVALDVIYHRLGDASTYAFFIDDASSKQRFYDQLSHLLEHKHPSRNHNNDIYTLEESMKELDQTFNQALKLLYQTQKQGKPIAYFFERYLKDKDININLIPKKVFHVMNSWMKHLDFDELDALEKTFDKDKMIKDFLEYHRMLSIYPFFSKLETKVSRSSLLEFNTFLEDLKRFKESTSKAWYFKKRRLRRKFMNNHQMKLSFLSVKKFVDQKLLKALISSDVLSTYLSDHIHELNKIKSNYLKLSPREITFLSMLHDDPSFKHIQIEKLRSYLFDAYITGFLEDFKASNQKYLYIINEYESKMEKLNTLRNEKQSVSFESFLMKLFRHALDLGNTKRIMDIKRILESEKKPSIKAFFDLFEVELLSNIKIFLMTPEAISSIMPLKYNLFDLVIFDEASQMYVEKGIPAIYRAKRVVIAGDPKQLRPSSLGMGRIEDEDFFEEDEVLRNVTYDAKSLLDLARYKYKEALLNYHYRSKYQELIEFSNHAFYAGKLIVSPNSETPLEPPISYLYVKEGTFLNKRNIPEAKAVIALLKKVLKDKRPEESVGIITFNSTQRDLIMNEIDQELFKKSVYQKRFEEELFRKDGHEDQSLFVKNIENVQGDERDIIIFSMGYAKDQTGIVKRRFGWLNHDGGQNRLNVAITRAKKKIIFVSSLYPEELKVDDLSGKGPKLLKDFMRYCYAVSTKNQELAKTILTSLYQKESETAKVLTTKMVDDLKERLTKQGYEVHESIGIGQFRIHLALYNQDTKNYMLGIICDLSSFDDLSARKELLHQEKFLTTRGWKIYRVFHMRYYENPTAIIKEIKEHLKHK